MDEPAFPVEINYTDNLPPGPIRGVQTGNYSGWATGLSKREWFAGMALQGLLASPRELRRPGCLTDAVSLAAEAADLMLNCLMDHSRAETPLEETR